MKGIINLPARNIRLTGKPTGRPRKAQEAKPTKAFAKKVMAVVNKEEETKYRADDVQKSQDVGVGLAVPTDLVSALPTLSQGVGSFQRVGQQIDNVRGKTHFSFSIPSSYAATTNWVVRVIMVSSRQVKSFAQIGSLAAGTLLDNGDGTTLDWNAGTTQVITLSQRPLANENFKGSFREFRLSKNSGQLNGDTSTPPPSANGGHFPSNAAFTWNWKHKGKLMYDETATRPNNYNPMFLLVAYPLDYSAIGEQAPIKATIRTEMYYKDV